MNSRRNFLIQAGILGAAVAIAPKDVFAKGKNAHIGIQLYTLRDEIPKGLEAVIAGIAKAGYNYVETYGYWGGKYFGLSVDEFDALLKKYKLYTVSGHYGMDGLLKTGSFDDVDNAIAAAKVLKQRYVIMPYIDGSLRKTEADIENIVQKVKLASKRIADAGLRMAYHNHDFEFEKTNGVMLYERLLKETDPKFIDFEMDLYWTERAGQNPHDWFKRFPGRFHLVHVKDMDKQNHHITTEVGKGTIDFKQIFSESKLGGIQYYIVEQENFAIPPYQSIGESAVALRKLLR